MTLVRSLPIQDHGFSEVSSHAPSKVEASPEIELRPGETLTRGGPPQWNDEPPRSTSGAVFAEGVAVAQPELGVGVALGRPPLKSPGGLHAPWGITTAGPVT
jgi:hypothetical protein